MFRPTPIITQLEPSWTTYYELKKINVQVFHRINLKYDI